MASVGDDTADEDLVICVKAQEKAGGINTENVIGRKSCSPGPTVFQYCILHTFMCNLII